METAPQRGVLILVQRRFDSLTSLGGVHSTPLFWRNGMTTQELVRRQFEGTPGLGAALSELATCEQYPQYVGAAAKETGIQDIQVLIIVLAFRRGNQWK